MQRERGKKAKKMSENIRIGHIFSYKYIPLVVINPLVNPTRYSLLVILELS